MGGRVSGSWALRAGSRVVVIAPTVRPPGAPVKPAHGVRSDGAERRHFTLSAPHGGGAGRALTPSTATGPSLTAPSPLPARARARPARAARGRAHPAEFVRPPASSRQSGQSSSEKRIGSPMGPAAAAAPTATDAARARARVEALKREERARAPACACARVRVWAVLAGPRILREDPRPCEARIFQSALKLSREAVEDLSRLPLLARGRARARGRGRARARGCTRGWKNGRAPARARAAGSCADAR
jgi:hypothetical protein